ncbi:hypothetical protein B0H13DRAFT_1949919, partial [Mycena leptocephala]
MRRPGRITPSRMETQVSIPSAAKRSVPSATKLSVPSATKPSVPTAAIPSAPSATKPSIPRVTEPSVPRAPPNNVHPHQTPNLGRSFSDSPAYALNNQNSGPRLPDPRAVNPEGVLAAQIDALRAARAGAGNPPFRNPPPLQSSVSTPEARRDFARNTRAPTWSSAPPPS